MTTHTTAPVTGSRLDRRALMLVMTGLMVTTFLSALDGTIVATAMPTIAGDLGGLSKLPWVVTAYLVTQTVASPLFGKLSDMYGRRTLLQLAVVVFLAGSLGCGVSQSMIQLVAWRGLQGIGAGGIMALSFTIVGDVVPPRERGRYIGLFTGVFGVSSVVGPLVGGAIVDHWGWRWTFLVNLPVGVVALVVTSMALRLSWTRSKHRVDFEGAALLVVAVTSLLLVTTWGGKEYAWGSPTIVGLAIAAVVLGCVLVWWEKRAEEPIVPLRLFKVPTFVVASVVSLLIASTMFGATAYLPLWFQTVKGTSATESGLRVAPMAVGLTIASILVGRRVTSTGRYRTWPIIGSTVAAVGCGVVAATEAGSSLWHMGIGQVLIGLGVGACMPILSIAVQNAVESRDLGSATAGLTFGRSLGGAIGVATYGAILFGRLQSDLRNDLPAGTDTSRQALERLVASPKEIRALPPDLNHIVVQGLGRATAFMFVVVTPLVLISAVASSRLRNITLGDTAAIGHVEAEPLLA